MLLALVQSQGLSDGAEERSSKEKKDKASKEGKKGHQQKVTCKVGATKTHKISFKNKSEEEKVCYLFSLGSCISFSPSKSPTTILSCAITPYLDSPPSLVDYIARFSLSSLGM